MLNLTIVSLSLLSYTSFSPLLTGKSNCVFHSNFKFFSSVIFFNPANLRLEKSNFAHGAGSIIIAERNRDIYFKETKELLSNNDYVSTNFSDISENSGSSNTIIIKNCRFLQITGSKEEIIRIDGSPTVYMTSLTFYGCTVIKRLFYLNSKSTTISHVCCSNLKQSGESDALFLYSSTQEGSFLKMIYSTIIGTGEELKSVRKLIYFDGTCSLNVQCLNISDIYIDSSNSNDKLIEFTSATCLNFLMNTFQNLNGGRIIHSIIQSNTKENGFYFGMSNFLNNKSVI